MFPFVIHLIDRFMHIFVPTQIPLCGQTISLANCCVIESIEELLDKPHKTISWHTHSVFPMDRNVLYTSLYRWERKKIARNAMISYHSWKRSFFENAEEIVWHKSVWSNCLLWILSDLTLTNGSKNFCGFLSHLRNSKLISFSTGIKLNKMIAVKNWGTIQQ